MSVADEVVRAIIAQGDAVTSATDANGRASARALLASLQRADQELEEELRRRSPALQGTFTTANARVYRDQARLAVERVQGALGATTTQHAELAIRQATRTATRTLQQMETAFTGIARPLPLRAATVSTQPGLPASLLRQHETSVDRYGSSMMSEIEERLRVGLLSGRTQEQVVNSLCRLRGPTVQVSLRAYQVQPGLVIRTAEENIPEGLFMRYRSWAWRIVRTEGAYAFSAGRMQGLHEQREDIPDLKKKIVATFDNRTGADSMIVHGQVRELEENFVDGASRSYLYPPARPHDREVVLPWRPGWPETDVSRPRTQAEIETRARQDGVKLPLKAQPSPPPRTVPRIVPPAPPAPPPLPPPIRPTLVQPLPRRRRATVER